MSNKIITKIPSKNLKARSKVQRRRVAKYLLGIIHNSIRAHNQMQRDKGLPTYSIDDYEFNIERMDDDWMKEMHSIHIYLKEHQPKGELISEGHE